MEDETEYEVLADTSTPEERQQAWDVGAGLQRIDGLRPGPVAYDLIAGQIAGHSTYREVDAELRKHYLVGPGVSAPPGEKEASLAAVRIAEIIRSPGFTLSPGALMAVHKHIFDGLLSDRRWEGRLRARSMGKAEPVLGGQSVGYSPGYQVSMALTWEFEQERSLDFLPADCYDAVSHVLRFASRIWQVHPFYEGNTRTVCAYSIRFLRDLGVNIASGPFAASAPYFRDAIVLDHAPRRLRDDRPLRLFGQALLDPAVRLPDLRAEYPKERQP